MTNLSKILLKNKEDIVGNKIGKLTVLRWLRHETKFNVGKKRNAVSKHVYECQCDCGIITEINRPDLISRHTISCGCGKLQQNSANLCWKGCGEISGRLWSSIKSKALLRNLEFSITIEQGWQKFLEQNKKCALSGLELKFSVSEYKKMNDRTASLDRIDSSKGYTINNIQWIDKRINVMKMDMDENEFIQICMQITKNKGY